MSKTDQQQQRRHVLITGASGEIGRAIARQIAAAGFDVVIHFHSDSKGAEKSLHDVLAAGGQGRTLRCDLRDRSETASVIASDIDDFGPYYGVILNAGIARDGAFPTLSGQDWDDVIGINLNGFYNVLHPLLPSMIAARAGGRIIAIASVSGIIGNRGQVNYSAAKAGLIGAVKALAIELARRQITVNCVAPGLIETAMSDMDAERRNAIIESIPLRRMGTVNEVASVVAFLASDAAAYVTRQVISVNGGMI